jgi:SynChlorMet cassette protein ScmC
MRGILPAAIATLATMSIRYREYEGVLRLADGARLCIAAGNQAACAVVSQLAQVMSLCGGISGDPPADPSAGLAEEGLVRRILVLVEPPRETQPPAPVHAGVWRAASNEEGDLCILTAPQGDELAPYRVMELSLLIAADAEKRGGVLLHGGLAERDGLGIILAGPGSVGKTTASRRLPPPWRSLCDDATLVVRDREGGYWAHPWPTWSRLMMGDMSARWDVQEAVRLRGIFFLKRAAVNALELIGPGQAVPALVVVAEQANLPVTLTGDAQHVRAARLQRFDNLCALAQATPAYILRLSLTGDFWREIEGVLRCY